MHTKSILKYYLDNNMFVNKHECSDFTPGFQPYIPTGVSNIDIENELRGGLFLNTKCIIQPNKLNPIKPKSECKLTILPNGFFYK